MHSNDKPKKVKICLSLWLLPNRTVSFLLGQTSLLLIWESKNEWQQIVLGILSIGKEKNLPWENVSILLLEVKCEWRASDSRTSSLVPLLPSLPSLPSLSLAPPPSEAALRHLVSKSTLACSQSVTSLNPLLTALLSIDNNKIEHNDFGSLLQLQNCHDSIFFCGSVVPSAFFDPC